MLCKIFLEKLLSSSSNSHLNIYDLSFYNGFFSIFPLDVRENRFASKYLIHLTIFKLNQNLTGNRI